MGRDDADFSPWRVIPNENSFTCSRAELITAAVIAAAVLDASGRCDHYPLHSAVLLPFEALNNKTLCFWQWWLRGLFSFVQFEAVYRGGALADS